MAMEQAAYEAFRKEIEDTEQIPHDKLWPALAGMWAFALMIPEKWGGLGQVTNGFRP